MPILWSLTGGLGLTDRARAAYQSAARSPFWLLEIDVPRCTLTHGTAPCAATAASDGLRCYYSRHTCRDTANFTSGTTTLRFCSDSIHIGRAPGLWASWSQVWPLLTKVSPVQQELDTTGGFTLPAAMTFHLSEFGNDDPGNSERRDRTLPVLDIDKSVRNETRAGQFWRRFAAIFPNYRGFDCRLKRGFAESTHTIYDLETLWTGKLENIGFEQPGGVTIKCADMYGADHANTERQIPRSIPARGRVTASAQSSDTDVHVVDSTAYPDPTTLDYTVYLRVVGGQELMALSSIISATKIGVTRGALGTIPEAIRNGDVLEEVIPYFERDQQEGKHPVYIIADLLKRAGVPASAIDDSQMYADGGVFNGLRLRRLITERKSAKSLINEICELTGASVYMDRSLRYRISVARPQRPGEVT